MGAPILENFFCEMAPRRWSTPGNGARGAAGRFALVPSEGGRFEETGLLLPPAYLLVGFYVYNVKGLYVY